MDEPAGDQAPCPEHVWQLIGLALTEDGMASDYACVRCPVRQTVPPGGQHPNTV